jgi:Arc/MetJ-type ribon-helix-helix transcriptional regulator
VPELKKKNSIYIGSKIPQKQRIILENAITNGDYLNISGFVRDAVKEKLIREGFQSSTKPTGEAARS